MCIRDRAGLAVDIIAGGVDVGFLGLIFQILADGFACLLYTSYIPNPERDEDKPFIMPVEDTMTITGRGTVATGRVEDVYKRQAYANHSKAAAGAAADQLLYPV